MNTRGWLLDANVLSELARPEPDPHVLAFIAGLERVITSSIVVFELERGVARLPKGRRKAGLTTWLATTLERVEVVAFDANAARSAARIEVEAEQRGLRIEIRDALILGAASSSDLGVATRNLAHLAGRGVTTIDPFAGR